MNDVVLKSSMTRTQIRGCNIWWWWAGGASSSGAASGGGGLGTGRSVGGAEGPALAAPDPTSSDVASSGGRTGDDARVEDPRCIGEAGRDRETEPAMAADNPAVVSDVDVAPIADPSPVESGV